MLHTKVISHNPPTSVDLDTRHLNQAGIHQIAQELYRLAQESYKNVTAEMIVTYKENKADHAMQNTINHYKKLSNWTTTILLENASFKTILSRIETLLVLVKECLALKDHNSAFAILDGLNNLGSVDIYLSHRKIPPICTKERKLDAVLS